MMLYQNKLEWLSQQRFFQASPILSVEANILDTCLGPCHILKYFIICKQLGGGGTNALAYFSDRSVSKEKNCNIDTWSHCFGCFILHRCYYTDVMTN